MIRNVVVHISNEQPLMTDLFDVPSSADAGLLCTNVRSMDGKRPIFIDSVEGTFFFPYHVIRFVEIPVGAIDRHAAEGGRYATTSPAATHVPAEAELESGLPTVIEAGAGEQEGDQESDLGDIDEDFLRRIRDI